MQQIFAPHATDFYKTGHYRQYPDGTQQVYANLTPRSGKYSVAVDKDHIVFWGAQMFVLDHLIDDWNKSFFHKPKDRVIAKYKRRIDTALGKGVVSADHMAALHDLGYLPLLIKTLPEGSLVPYKVTPMTIQNTHPDFAWVTLYIESAASAYLWKTITSATTAYNFRLLLNQYCVITGASTEAARFQLHDFSLRGLSGLYDGYVSGTGHFLSSAGSDTILAYDALEEFYGADAETELIGGGVPATEHSVMCMGGKETELDTYRSLLKKYPTGIISIVSDTWDYWKLLREGLTKLRPIIMSRQKDALGFCKTVIRPDSGDPVRIVAGYLDHEIEFCSGPSKNEAIWECKETGKRLTYDEVAGSIAVLWDIFGGTCNSKGYMDLDEHIGLIYGDSINLSRMEQILSILKEKGFSANNAFFGIGSYSYQGVTRDTHGIAFKATHGIVNGEDRELFKNPITDDGTKKSACGYICVKKNESGEYYQIDQVNKEEEKNGSLLTPLFYNGFIFKNVTLSQARAELGVF